MDFNTLDKQMRRFEQSMDSGFRIIYGYTQSDEISLLFHLQELASDGSRWWDEDFW